VPEAATYRPVEAHRNFYETTLKFPEKELRLGHDLTRELLQCEMSPATFVYVYCHGEAANPFGGQPNEGLELEEGRKIGVNTFGPTRDRFPKGPIVFLNSCSSGAFSPLVFSSFLDKFRENGAEGMVASAFPVPIDAAAAFGQEVLRRYLHGEPIGDVLFNLRRSLILLGNPLGFFYTLHCPHDLRTEVAGAGPPA
jgi:CHAT domain